MNGVQELADSLRPCGGAGYRSLVVSLAASRAIQAKGIQASRFKDWQAFRAALVAAGA
jgi:hypothetical protein